MKITRRGFAKQLGRLGAGGMLAAVGEMGSALNLVINS